MSHSFAPIVDLVDGFGFGKSVFVRGVGVSHSFAPTVSVVNGIFGNSAVALVRTG